MTPNAWSVPIQGLVDRAIVRLEVTYRKFAFNVFRAVMERTPVDSGRFLSNWNVTAGAPNYSYTNSTSVGRALIQLEKVFELPAGRGFYIANGLPYGELLEYAGWSHQAPQGMIRVTMAEVALHLRRAKAE